MTDDYAIPHRDELEAAVDAVTPQEGPAPGPFARPAVSLLAANRAPIRQLLARYDELAARARSEPARAVLTHGEPTRHHGSCCARSSGAAAAASRLRRSG